MIDFLVKLAADLDSRGLYQEADSIDLLIEKLATSTLFTEKWSSKEAISSLWPETLWMSFSADLDSYPEVTTPEEWVNALEGKGKISDWQKDPVVKKVNEHIQKLGDLSMEEIGKLCVEHFSSSPFSLRKSTQTAIGTGKVEAGLLSRNEWQASGKGEMILGSASAPTP